ncbi:MAG: hypothetical protein RLN85_10635 [Pseudomonadales bacterium]
MAGYRDVAVNAADLIVGGNCAKPVEAWDQATKRSFPSSESLREKGCPKGAFLGLCNAGLIQGVEPDNYARHSKNGDYAVAAVEVLRRNKFMASQPNLLWKKVAGNAKTHNHQMDVVIGLWEAGLLGS